MKWPWSETAELRKENRRLRRDLTQALQRAQELALQQQASLDRVITSRFDQPIISKPLDAQPSGVSMPIPFRSDLLNMSDEEFLNQ